MQFRSRKVAIFSVEVALDEMNCHFFFGVCKSGKKVFPSNGNLSKKKSRNKYQNYLRVRACVCARLNDTYVYVHDLLSENSRKKSAMLARSSPASRVPRDPTKTTGERERKKEEEEEQGTE